MRWVRRSATLGVAISLLAPAVSAQSGIGVARGFRTEVLIWHSPAPTTTERMGRQIAACRSFARLEPGDSAALVGLRAGDAPQTPGIITVVLLASEGARLACGDSVGRVAAAARSLRFSYDTTYVANRDIVRAALMRGSEAVTPARAERTSSAQLTPSGIRDPGHGVVVLDFLVDSIAPDSTGHFGAYGIEALYADIDVPDRFPLPDALLERVWLDAFETSGRLKALAPDAQRLFSELRRGALGGDARREARIRVASAFAQAGEDAAARLMLGHALRTDPCLGLDSSAATPVRDALAGITRPPARCDAIPLRRVALRGAMLPGFGRPAETPLRTVINSLIIAGIVGTGVMGVTNQLAAYDSYDSYKAVQYRISDPDTASLRAAEHYAAAEDSRLVSRQMYFIATGLWVASVAEGVLREHLYARYLDRVRASGATDVSRTGLAPVVAPGRIGIALTLPRLPGGPQ